MVDHFYHGTQDLPALLAAFEAGELTHDHAVKRDPGDFGLGFYVTRSRVKAAAYGQIILVQIDISGFAHIPNPYFIAGELEEVTPRTDVEKLFHELVFDKYGMRTVAGALEDRHAVAVRITERFMRAGYNGIRTSTYGDDVVVFNPAAIKGITFGPGDEDVEDFGVV